VSWWEEPAPLGKVYALLLNDMRESHIENIQIVRLARVRKDILDWYGEMACEPYTDVKAFSLSEKDVWRKYFRRGSELEWFNPDHSVGKNVLNDEWGGIWLMPQEAYVGWGVRVP
jgi:hypothetical protein